MKTRILTTAVALILGGTMVFAQNKSQSDKMGSSSAKEEKDSTYYTCSMHPEVKMDKPGSCPKCGMTLDKKTKGSGKMKMNHGRMHSMSKMKDMKMTGDFDLDFANMMILHHQAAIDMSEEELEKGSDERIKAMAKNIITAQKGEIGQLKAFIKKYKMPATKMKPSDMHNELSDDMKAMMDTMDKVKTTGNADMDFVRMMIPHHESAVKMATDELSHGKQLGLKKMAQKMIADQSKEIEEFRSWSSKQK